MEPKSIQEIKEGLMTRDFNLASPDDLLFLAGSLIDICVYLEEHLKEQMK